MKRIPFAPFTKYLEGSLSVGLGIGREVGASLIASELYPFGLVGSSFPVVPPLRRRNEPSKQPVLFVHGVFHNRSAFAWLKQRLAWNGVRRFHELNLRTTWTSIAQLAEQVEAAVRFLMKKHGTTQVDIVAHSLGGMVARYFVQREGGDGLMGNLITVGTPHQGTPLSHLSPFSTIRELKPGGTLIQDLNKLKAPRFTQALAISGSLDVFTRPGRSGWWSGVRNIELTGLGHTGLLFSKRVARLVEARLLAPLSNEPASA